RRGQAALPVHHCRGWNLWSIEDSGTGQPYFQRQRRRRRLRCHSDGCGRGYSRCPVKMAAEDPQFNAAKRLYAEQFGDAIVTSMYLKIALLAVSLIAAGLIYSNVKTARMVANFKPLVIRINDVGRAEAINYSNLAYKPQDAEIKYFLSEFCRLYYSRNRYTIRDNFSKALLFMDGQLSSGVQEAWKKDKLIENYLNNPQADVEVDVVKVSIEDLRSAP